MKELTDILRGFNTIHNMEFCDDFAKIQTVVNYCNDYIKTLNKIHFSGGNGPYITELTNRLLREIHNKGYINNDHALKPLAEIELRKITFYLILNTDAIFKYDLNEDTNICHLLNSMPKLTKCLLMNCIFNLKLEPFFYEMIQYSPNWFALQFFECAAEHIKDLKPYEVLVCVENLIKSVYTNIARSDYQLSNNVDKKVCLGKYLDFLMGLLRHFFSPDAENFTNWKKLQFYKYFGFVMKHIVDIITYCFEIYQKKPEYDINDKYKIYYLMQGKEILINNNSNFYSETINEILTQINILLLNTLQTIIEKLTLDIFLYMVEIDHDDETTLQQYVGESLFNIMEILLKNQWFEHDVIKRLETIAIRPKTLQEFVKESTLGHIMFNLNKYREDLNTRKIWIKEFLHRGEIVFGNLECLESVVENLDAFTFDEVKICIEFLRNEDIDYEIKIKEIIIKSLQHQNIDDIIQLILYSIELFGTDTDYLQLETFHISCTEYFNKFTSDNNENNTILDIKKYLILFVQNPLIFIRLIFEQSLKNECQEKYIINLIINSKDLIELYVENELKFLLEKNLNQIPINELNLMPIFLSDLFLVEIINKKDFINILYNHILKSLKNHDFKLIFILINSFLIISKRSGFNDVTSPVLIMAGQIIDQCRWDIISYTEELDEILKVTIELVQNINRNYITKVTNKDRIWLTTKIKLFKPMTKYYYQKYFLHKEEKQKYFDEFLHPVPFTDDKNEIISFLCETFVRCTSKEADWLSKNSLLADNLMDTILLLSAIVSKTTINNSMNCLRNCFMNFVRILKVQILPSKTSQEKLILLKELFNVIERFPEQIYENIFLCVQPLIIEIIETSSSPENATEITNILEIITNLPDVESKDFLLEKINIMKI